MSFVQMFNEINLFYSENIGIEIRKENELYENEKVLIEHAKLNDLAPIEAWTALGTNMQLGYATHGLFRYFGKFPPPVATYLINKYTQEGDLVIDPMVGSGTTAVESVLLGRRCIANDINPMSCLLTKVKTTYINEEILKNGLNRIIDNYKPLTTKEYDYSPVAIKNPNHWFLDKTSNSLRGIKFLIEKENNIDLKDFMNIVFAATVRRVSRATTQQGRLFLDAASALEDALPTFIKRFNIGIKGLAAIPQNCNVKYYNGDIKDYPEFTKEEKTKLIIMHPPYFNSYKYSSINSLETGWLGINRNEFSKREVKEFFKIGKPENAEKYVQDMALALSNALAGLLKDGRLALMIGDTIMKQNHIPVTRMLIDKVDLSSFEIEKIAIRVPKYTEATWVASQRRNSNNIGITLYDYIVIFRRMK